MPCRRRENVPPDSEANVSLDNAYRPILASSDQIGPENEPESDEALAWRMMQEEETAFRQRMMALAGISEYGWRSGDCLALTCRDIYI